MFHHDANFPSFVDTRSRHGLSALPGLALAVALIAPASGLAAEPNPERNAYFGETHQHTSWSVDAWLFGNHLTGPDDALKYAQGATLKHPLGYDIRIEQPLDWMGVTDHSEYVGVTKMANTPGSALSKMPQAQPLILKDPNNPEDVQKVFNYLVSLVSKPPIKAFMSPEVAGSIWKENVKIADENNKPGKFTPQQIAEQSTSLQSYRQPEGGIGRALFGGAGRGAALGAIGGAIAGDAGEGAAIGAAIGGFGGFIRHRRLMEEQHRYNDAVADRERAAMDQFEQAYSTCLRGRGYTVG